MFNYKPYLKSLANFMADHGYTVRPFPKFILDDEDQGDGVFVYTGYFDPNSNGIRLFVHNRHPKEVLQQDRRTSYWNSKRQDNRG